jgi:hypothetical protein
MAFARGIEQVLDQHLLRLAERHDAEAAARARRIAQTLHDLGDERFGLDAILLRTRAVVDAVDEHAAHAEPRRPVCGPGKVSSRFW